MPLKITYWTGPGKNSKSMYGALISGESLTITATSALAGATPTNAGIVTIVATENANFDYSSATSVASATRGYIAAGQVIDLDAEPGFKVAGITA